MKSANVLDSHIAYREVGPAPGPATPTVVFLHGNPTSSYLWRNVLPSVSAHARCLAPDLIGMGDSGKPEIGYRLADHVRYLDAFIETLAGPSADNGLFVVGIDWGGVLALDWAARHPTRARGVSVMETFLRPAAWSDWSPQGAELFRAYRTPGVGERMVLEENMFLAKSLEHGARNLTDADRAAYYAPYPTPTARRPLLAWPREIPIDGEPADVVEIFERFGAWMRTSDVPKQLITFDPPAALSSPAAIAWAKENMRALEHVALGSAGHHAPEERAPEIADAVGGWLRSAACS